jgi:hypothetical protein
MINTKCKECMFSHSDGEKNDNPICSKNIIEQIKDIKNIKQEDGFNIIENYACRYGFSKQIYEQHKEQWDPQDFENRMLENSRIRYYLLLDCYDPDLDFNHILQQIPKLNMPPKSVSFMFRSLNFRPFVQEHQDFLLSNYKNIRWKAHNFLEEMSLEEGIDHILSTNAKNNDTSIFLVYNAKDLQFLDRDVNTINKNMILYQSPMIAIIDRNNTLYRLAMSFDNYKVAKTLGPNLIPVLTQESNIVYY